MKSARCAVLFLALVSYACGSPETGTTHSGSGGPPGRDPSRPDNAEYFSVTEAYGPLWVKEGRETATANVIPWSAYFYAAKDDLLFRGADSTFAKYDQYIAKTRNREGKAVSAAREAWPMNQHAPPWEGLCHAWSVASLIEAEPRKEIVRAGIRFDVSDLKALLLTSYGNVGIAEHYGQIYLEHPDYELDDVYPDQFHRFVQAELIQKQQPFMMDIVPGVEIWNHTFYDATFDVTRDSSDPYLMHVRALLVGADLFSKEDRGDIGTKVLAKEYFYELYGNPEADGRFRVLWGRWVNPSRIDHPDYVIPSQDFARASSNSGISPCVVDEILGKTPSGDCP